MDVVNFLSKGHVAGRMKTATGLHSLEEEEPRVKKSQRSVRMRRPALYYASINSLLLHTSDVSLMSPAKKKEKQH